MRRVVVTGLGIVSSIGNNVEEVLASLQAGTSGIVASPEMAFAAKSLVRSNWMSLSTSTNAPFVSWAQQPLTRTLLWPKPLLTRV